MTFIEGSFAARASVIAEYLLIFGCWCLIFAWVVYTIGDVYNHRWPRGKG